MTSWFGAAAGSGASLFQNLKDAVPIPENIAKTIKELSLNSDEMVAEREQLKREEEEKVAKKKWSLENFMLPWETKDEERCILCEECKEMIMKLSMKQDVFLGPYKEGEDGKEPAAILLPVYFDLEYYVGVIKKLLELDQNLDSMHAYLIGEDLISDSDFWKNYFHHCALARIEIGLDTDEFWSQYMPKLIHNTPAVTSIVNESGSTNNDEGDIMKPDGGESVKSVEITFSSHSTTTEEPVAVSIDDSEPFLTNSQSPNREEANISFNDNSSEFNNVSTNELDDLAAEIAKELEG